MLNLYKLHKKPEKLDNYQHYAYIFSKIGYLYNASDYNYDPVRHIIKKCPRWANWYAQCVIKGRWIDAEPYIMKDSAWAALYAKDVIGNRWKEAEPYIKKDVLCWRSYCRLFYTC